MRLGGRTWARIWASTVHYFYFLVRPQRPASCPNPSSCDEEHTARFENWQSVRRAKGLKPLSPSAIESFEENIAEKFGFKHVIGVASGTAALILSIKALGIGPGDEVISPALTVIMDAYAAIHLGAVPVFADVDPTTWNIDPEDVERKITSKTRAILVVSWAGLPVDMDPILEIAERHNLLVVEDSAQTLLSTYKGQQAGTIGHLGVYSFESKKHMTCGSEGGMVVSSDPELATRARKFGGIGYKHMTANAGRTHLAMSTVQRRPAA